GLVLTLIDVHRVVVVPQQRLYPFAMQVDRAAAGLLGERLVHDRRQTLVVLAAEPLVDIVQALLQTFGECSEALLTLFDNELGTEIDHVVLQDPRDAAFEAVLQPHQRITLHALEQRQRNRAAPHQAGFVFENELPGAARLHLQQTNRQGILEIDLRRLRGGALAETRATVIGQPFQVDAVIQARQYFGLAGAGHAADQDEVLVGGRLIEGIEQEMPHRLVAAGHPRVVDTRLGLQPVLDDLRTKSATETVDVALRIVPGEIGPGLNPLVLGSAADQLVAKLDGRRLTMLLEAGADLLPFEIGHQRQVHDAGKGALGELHRGPRIHHGKVIEEQRAIVVGVTAHQRTSTAKAPASTSSPIGSSFRPSSPATARNSASPSGATATSSPPLVCGSQSNCLCASSSVAIRSP